MNPTKHLEISIEADIEKCLKVLNAGGVILYPTDTVWGLGCDATNEKAVEKIIALKQRPAQKSFVVLVASERDILKYIASPDISVFDYLKNNTKPVTVIYENAIGIAENAVANDGSVAIRMCREYFCRTLIKRFRKPIVSTSANISGEKTPTIFGEINEQIKPGVDYIVRYRQEDEQVAEASAIIKWKNGKAEVIRK
jgi:L-threonylcarbamoyladenylate synthase